MADVRQAVRLVAAAAPLALLLLPSAAQAERDVLRDAHHDAVRVDRVASQAVGRDVTRPASDETTIDVVRVVADHGFGTLLIRIEVRDLRDTFTDLAVIKLRTQQRVWGVRATRMGEETFTRLTRGHRQSARQCGGLLTEVDGPGDALVVSVPTECIEDPSWVRVGVRTVGYREGHSPRTGDRLDVVVDEAGVTGFHGDGDPVLGPRIRRG